MIIVLSFTKRKIKKNGIELFTSVNLTVFLLIILLFFIQIFLINENLSVITMGISVAYIVFMWYILIVLLYQTTEKFFSLLLCRIFYYCTLLLNN